MSAYQHIEWLNLVEKTGPFLAVGVLADAFAQGLEKVETRRRQRVRSAYDEWRDAVDENDPQLESLHAEWVRLILFELLEYEDSVLKPADELPETLIYREPLSGAEVQPDWAVLSEDQPRLLISVHSPSTDLDAPLAGETWSATPIERMIATCRALKVPVALVTNGEEWSLISVPPDQATSVGTWYSRIWQQEPVTLQAFVSLLEVRRCFGPSEGTLETLFTKSLEHQDEVTDTLGEQVRRAVEVLVQALDRADQDRNRELLRDVSPAQLYEAGLTVMMRLVVLLCAEERKLLLLGEPIYDQHYAVSTLRSGLLAEKERLGEEVLERRHDAWSRLLAVFRAVFGGIEHEMLRLPALAGSLFDPDRFPFLEGRAAGTSWRTEPAIPLPIDNRTVLMLLSALQVLEQSGGAQLLSYEALDVEQIGHVYEGLLERTVERVPETTIGFIGSQKAVNPNVPLRELEEKRSNGEETLIAFLKEKTGRSASALGKAFTKPLDDGAYQRILLAAGGDIPLAERIKPFAHLLRTDSWGEPLIYRDQAFSVTLGTGRRETGTHYTPKSLTEPIVQHTLEPLVYVGPAEGAPVEEWQLKQPADLLALKICDMAMGSGAFLVQACRWVADRLVESWDGAEKAGHCVSMEGQVLENAEGAELLPRDKAERVLIARRLVASRCIYGVDINPMAVELAKVSLWLVTMMRNRPFTFLDHALKCGDSLLGVSALPQIENFSLRPGERQVTFATSNLFRYVEQAGQKRRELEDLPSNDHTQIETKNRLHAEAEAEAAKVKALADCLIALELRGLDGGAYADARETEADQVQRLLKQDAEAALKTPNSNQPSTLAARAKEQLRARRPFHWPVEFPEVFACGGFHAFVGNPPFMWGMRISTVLGTDYYGYLKRQIEAAPGTADFAVYFFQRTTTLLRTSGLVGLIITNTISQGDAKDLVREILSRKRLCYIRAAKDVAWPGAAAVQIASIHVAAENWQGIKFIGSQLVQNITADLEDSSEEHTPHRLVCNSSLSFTGHYLLGLGFLLNEEDEARIVSANSRNETVIFPFLTGNDVNSNHNQRASRRAINFGFRELEDADAFPEALAIVRQKVKPDRDRDNRKAYRERWWRYAEARPVLSEKLEQVKTVFVQPTPSKYTVFARVPSNQVFAHPMVVVPTEDFSVFASLISSIHELWARRFSSTLGQTLRYSPSDCLETFSFPVASEHLRNLGETYEAQRWEIANARSFSLTDTYNRFHDCGEASADIARLRALHVELDQAVAAAYGWRDLDLGHGFHATKQGERYTLSEPARRTVLDRLLALNHQRYEEEVKVGLHDKKGKKTTAKPKRGRKSGTTEASLELQLE